MTSVAYQSPLQNRPSALTPFVLLSVAGHVAVVGTVLALNWVLESPRIQLDQKPIMASIVRQGKKRDEQLLPRKEPEAAPAAQEKIPIPTPGVKPEPKPKNTAETPADKKKSLFDAFNKTSKHEEVEGEENGDPRGDSAKQEGERYYGIIKAAVHRHYDVSNTIPEAERIQLKADVSIRLDAEGNLLDIALVRESSNPVFNNAVLAAIKKAAPFGPPPAPLRGPLKKDGVTLRFTP